MCDKILANPTVPTIDEMFSQLLWLVTPFNHIMDLSPTIDSSLLQSQITDNRASWSMKIDKDSILEDFVPSVVIVIGLDTLFK